MDNEKEELNSLFEILSKELNDYQLSLPEIIFLRNLLMAILLNSFSEEPAYKSISEIINKEHSEQELKDIITRLLPKNNSGKIPYFTHYMTQNSCIVKVLKTYLTNISFEDLKNSFIKELKQEKKTSDYTTALSKETSTSKVKWCIHTKNKIIEIPDAIFVWPAVNNFHRFIDKTGKWGFFDNISFRIVNLPDKIILLDDFYCFRARVLQGDYSDIPCNYDEIKDDAAMYINKARWRYIDTNANFINNEEYTTAEHFHDFKAKVSQYNKSFMWGALDKYEKFFPCPYDKELEIDYFGNFTKENQQQIDDVFEKIKKEKSRREFMRDLANDYDDEDDIMNALEGGYGDIYGF